MLGQVVGAVPTIVSVPQIYVFVVRISKGPRPMFGVDTDMRRRPLLAPLPDCEYSIIPLLPETSNGGRAGMMSGNKSQLMDPGVRHWQLVAFVVVHCAYNACGTQIRIITASKMFFMWSCSEW